MLVRRRAQWWLLSRGCVVCQLCAPGCGVVNVFMCGAKCVGVCHQSFVVSVSGTGVSSSRRCGLSGGGFSAMCNCSSCSVNLMP